MRTKSLLLSAAALVAGALSVQAQSNVYSVNVVGYVNVQTPAGQFALLANPLDNGTNNLTSLLPNVPNGTQVQKWTGSGFQIASKNPPLGAWNTNLVIPPGTGFFIRTPSAQTNTFVGSVVIGYGQTNSLALPGGVFSLVGSPVPISGSLTNVGNNALNINSALGNGSQIQVWNGTGFQIASKNPPFGNWNTNLLISVGQGFFVRPNAATTWTQALQ